MCNQFLQVFNPCLKMVGHSSSMGRTCSAASGMQCPGQPHPSAVSANQYHCHIPMCGTQHYLERACVEPVLAGP